MCRCRREGAGTAGSLILENGRELPDYTEEFAGLTVAERLALYRPLTTKGVKVFRDDREECICKSSSGRREYQNRTWFVFQVYDRKCRLCGRDLLASALTADHIQPRGNGGGWRDDRISNLWPAHYFCNGRRGSRRIYEGGSCPSCRHDVVVGLIYHECFRCGSQW